MLNDETIEGFGFGQQESAYIREGFGNKRNKRTVRKQWKRRKRKRWKRVLYNYLIHSFRFHRFRFRRFHCFRTVRLFRCSKTFTNIRRFFYDKISWL